MSAPSERQFRVLHALRVKGFAKPDALAELIGVGVDEVEAALAELADHGLVRFREARSLWQLTPDGREVHAASLAEATADTERTALAAAYSGFLDLNRRFKDLCGEWQLRPGLDGHPVQNDHHDPRYEALVIGKLLEVDAQVQPMCGEFALAVDRFAPYGPRLAATASRVAAGETRLFTGVMCGSYHDVWMELHEDLIVTLGIDRTAEGSF